LSYEMGPKRKIIQGGSSQRGGIIPRFDPNGNACWFCGEEGHTKKECTNGTAAYHQFRKTICFHCRKIGHSVQDCPSKRPVGNLGICFNCGKDDHRLKDCYQPIVNGGASFATCFVCGDIGHLSSTCTKNKHGLYPKGGSCLVCSSVDHFAKDCPNRFQKPAVEEPNNNKDSLPTINDNKDSIPVVNNTNEDDNNLKKSVPISGDDDSFLEVPEDLPKTKKKKPKVVKF